MRIREGTKGIEHLVEYTEVRSPCCNSIIHLGHAGGEYLYSEANRPYQLIGDSEDLRTEIIRLDGLKQQL